MDSKEIIELKTIPVVSFKENNIVFFQDMQHWSGVPSNVDFSVTKYSNGYKFIGESYGSMSGKYGNGAIYIINSHLPEYFHEWYNNTQKQ